jgi:hypothetical protein
MSYQVWDQNLFSIRIAQNTLSCTTSLCIATAGNTTMTMAANYIDTSPELRCRDTIQLQSQTEVTMQKDGNGD